ncbi:MAG: hypothetical protein ACXWMB_02240 [Candidatus Limnocylindria bacterium]
MSSSHDEAARRTSDIDALTPQQRASIPHLIRQAVAVANYGLVHDGCPFCGQIVEHTDDCVALLFGATTGRAIPEG